MMKLIKSYLTGEKEMSDKQRYILRIVTEALIIILIILAGPDLYKKLVMNTDEHAVVMFRDLVRDDSGAKLVAIHMCVGAIGFVFLQSVYRIVENTFMLFFDRQPKIIEAVEEVA